MATTDAAPPDVDALTAFFDHLSRNGFQAGLPELLRAQELMLAMLAQGRLPATLGERLAALQPLLCRNAEQQRQFGVLLARWSPPGQGGGRTVRARVARAAQAGRLPRWPLRLRVGLAVVAVLLVVGLSVLAWQTCGTTGLCKPPVQAAPAGDPEPIAHGVEPSLEPPGSFDPVTPIEPPGHLPLQGGGRAWTWVLPAIGGLAMATLAAMAALLLLRRLALQPLRTDARLEQRTLFAPRARLLHKVPPLLRLASRELRRPRRTDRLELDLGATIAATVRGGGAFAARYRPRSGTPEYLVLIDQRGPADQLARAAEDIVAALDRQGVALNAWRFSGDPSSCMPLRLDGGAQRAGTARRRVRLSELAARAAGQRLMVFADAAQLVDPLDGELREGLDVLSHFGACMLFTPMPVPGWGAAEQALDRHGVLVLPLQIPGLASGADWLSSQRALLTLEPDWPSTYPPRLLQHGLLWLARADAPPADELQGLLFELQLYLGPRRFQWLCGCAAFPVPSWPVTLVLAPLFLAPGDDVITGAIALASLPWLREGAWPMWLREALLQRLAPAQADAVARELRRRLDAASLGRPTEAADALAEVALAPGLLSRCRHWARQAWRRLATDAWVARTPGRLRRDVLFLGFIQRGVAQRLMQRVPERLRRQVFQEGVPLLGLRPWLPATALLLAAAGIAVQLPPLRGRVEAALAERAAGRLPEVASFALAGTQVNALAYSPDGVWLAAAFADGRLMLLRRDGTVADELAQASGTPVRELRFSANGQALMALPVLVGGGTRVFNRDGGMSELPAAGADPARVLSLSGDGTLLADAAPNQPLRLWQLGSPRSTLAATGPRLLDRPVLVPGLGGRSWLVALPDGRVQRIGVDRRADVDPGTSRIGITALALDAAGRRVAIGHRHRLRWRGLATDDGSVLLDGLDSPVRKLAVRADGSALLATFDDGSVRLLPWTGGPGIDIGQFSAGEPVEAEFSADGRQVIAIGYRLLTVLPSSAGVPLVVRPVRESVAALSPNGRQVAVRADDGGLRILGERLPVTDAGRWRQPVAAGPAEPAASAASSPAPGAAPDVLGLPQQEALARLKKAGFDGEVHTDEEVPDVCAGRVLAQHPAPTGARRLRLTLAHNTTAFYNLTCRGDLADIQRATGSQPGFEQLSFTMRKAGTGPASDGLLPGQCTWDDRGFRPGEPLKVRIDVTPTQRRQLMPVLASDQRYVVFRAVNRGEWMRAGCTVAVDARPPGPPRAAEGAESPLLAQVQAYFDQSGKAPAFNEARASDIARRVAPDVDLLALALALVKNEAGDFQPRTEKPSQFNTPPGGPDFGDYEPGGRLAKGLGNTEKGDGARYRGRGILMIVGRANYARYGELAGLGDKLVQEPERAADYQVAMEIFMAALKRVSPQLKRPIDADGVRQAQRLINGNTNADKLVRDFEAAKPLAATLLGVRASASKQ